MSNYKVKVNNEAESKEVQELFFELGFAWLNTEKIYRDIGKNTHISSFKYSNVMDLGMGNGAINHKELTIQQLKDLVVLKRNDVFDKTHYCDTTNSDYFVSSDNVVYFFNDEKNNTWQKSNYDLSELKPIIKPLKEYLVPQDNGKYALIKATEKRVSDWIEVPEPWMDFVYKMPDGEFRYSDVLDEFKDEFIVWQRHTQPEELPFVDDESKSLNDTYAEIEQVRQDSVNNPQHYNKGGVECIDAIEASMTPEAFKGYLKGNVQKYMWRYEHKGGKESLQKAQWYLNKLISKL